MEAGRGQKSAPARKKRLTADGKAARQERIFARLREGWAYQEIAREERLTARRVRQIVAEVRRRREVEGGSAHPRLPLSRLGPLLQAAGELVAEGDVRAIAPLMKILDKVLDRLDRRETVARAVPVDGDGNRETLPARTSALSAGPAPDEAAAEPETREASPPQTAAARGGDAESRADLVATP